LLKLRPAGKAPDAIVQEYGVVPLLAVSVDEYAVPTVPLGNEVVLIVSVGALVMIENGLVAFCTGKEESVTWTVKLDWPALLGIPLIVPSLLRLRPAGNVPDTSVHEYGVVPPEAVSIVEYAVPTVALGNEPELIISSTPAALMLMEKGLIAF
jgi:hypothetical protein